ncbi:MAG: hypothetical protein HYZ50_27125 [Deltaproteobacteria bacterium]|nr:hypothetical protein [Deltaproteobacteria bacterium]
MQSYLFSLGRWTLSVAVFWMAGQVAWAAGVGKGGEPQTFHVCEGGPSAGLECSIDDECPGSSCVETRILPDLPRVCKNGPHKGEACTDDANCGNGQCVIEFADSTPTTIRGVLTIMVDDDETNLDTGESCKTATVLIEVDKSGQHYLLSQTYACMPVNYDLDVDFLRTESGLNQSVMDGSLLNRLLFRGADGGPDDPAAGELAQALRDIFQTTGRPIVISTPERLSSDNHADRQADGLASVVRLKVAIRFVQP